MTPSEQARPFSPISLHGNSLRQNYVPFVLATAASVDDAAGVPPLFKQVAPEQVPRLSKVWADSKFHNYALKDWTKQERPTWDLEIVSRPQGARGFVLLTN
jgi:putative transposase